MEPEVGLKTAKPFLCGDDHTLIHVRVKLEKLCVETEVRDSRLFL